MWQLFQAGGWLMYPILACSILAITIFIDRLIAYRRRKIVPKGLLKEIEWQIQHHSLNAKAILRIKQHSPLGRMLAAGLKIKNAPRSMIKEAMEEEGRQIVHELERYLNALGTIAAISPLLGLLGTVLGMIQVFTVITSAGVGDPEVLAGGISQALITTAAGLSVAIPSLVAHRYLLARLDGLVVEMEKQAIHLLEIIHYYRKSKKS